MQPLIANARMHSVSSDAAVAWRRLFDWLARSSGVPLTGGRIGFTSKGSHSGFNAVRRLLMGYPRPPGGTLYASAVGPLVTPRRSLESVVSGDCDVAPVDSYAHALLTRYCPELTAKVRTIAMTDVCPMPMLAASAGAESDAIARLRASLVAATQDGAARPPLDDLLLDGFAEVDAADYAVTQAWAREADLANASVLATLEQPIACPTP